jgi:hypothetical protein
MSDWGIYIGGTVLAPHPVLVYLDRNPGATIDEVRAVCRANAIPETEAEYLMWHASPEGQAKLREWADAFDS